MFERSATGFWTLAWWLVVGRIGLGLIIPALNAGAMEHIGHGSSAINFIRLAERGQQVTPHLAYGDPTEEIVRLARALPADLIVVGHKKQSALALRWWKSSVGASLLEQSPCSILVAVCDP